MKEVLKQGDEGNYEEALIEILYKDFEELSESELIFLRKCIRYRFQLDACAPITDSMTLNAYLSFKRRLIPELDTITFCTYPVKYDSPFMGSDIYYPVMAVPTFEGLNRRQVQSFLVGGYLTLPLLTVFYYENNTTVYCIAPDGNFCEISSKNFKLEI